MGARLARNLLRPPGSRDALPHATSHAADYAYGTYVGATSIPIIGLPAHSGAKE
ncbi:hypothetical protein OG874_01575 [Nocardia sp. NBC_00565]|uniref:hypothetical protein n=1 Tax=Nocardia sp. NBC_00565 TaxID=2975993 RepID=UPI002E805627|nr:hypothetical protein [Nocardia sp. NBC_00565]WUC03933.1 hypothetical protein OG874_01575 [Nocardia sp. NBC_00565]